MIHDNKRIWSMLLFLAPCLLMSGCYRGSITKRIEPENRHNHQARNQTSQSSGIGKILAPAQWYVAFLALDGCIAFFLILCGLLKGTFGSDSTIETEAIQEDGQSPKSVQVEKTP